MAGFGDLNLNLFSLIVAISVFIGSAGIIFSRVEHEKMISSGPGLRNSLAKCRSALATGSLDKLRFCFLYIHRGGTEIQNGDLTFRAFCPVMCPVVKKPVFGISD